MIKCAINVTSIINSFELLFLPLSSALPTFACEKAARFKFSETHTWWLESLCHRNSDVARFIDGAPKQTRAWRQSLSIRSSSISASRLFTSEHSWTKVITFQRREKNFLFRQVTQDDNKASVKCRQSREFVFEAAFFLIFKWKRRGSAT